MLGFDLSAAGAGPWPAAAPILAPARLLAASVVPPVLILVLCVAAGIGTVMLLPSRREGAFRKLGGVIVLAAALILAALLVRTADHFGWPDVYFWVFSAIALAGALRVITHPRPVYSALYFVLTVFASAGLFVLLWAEFMAAALVLIYAGAILITYCFVIMLAAEASPSRDAGSGAGGGAGASGGETTPLSQLAEHDAVSREPVVAGAVGFALMGVLLFVIFDRAGAPAPVPPERAVTLAEAPDRQPFSPEGATQALGEYLFSHQLISLELAGLILTLSMVGAIVIARLRVVGAAETAVPADTGVEVVGPATPVDDNPHSIPVYGTENPRQKAYPET